jgi:hypothetical protein
MIGKPEWFTYKIFGWGIMPRTWQGFAYVFVSIIIAGIIILAPVATIIKMWLLGILVGAIFLDALHIMTQLQLYHDERQNYHQLIIEKNVSFAAACAVIGGILFQTYQNRDLIGTGQLPFDISLGIVLGIMLIVKILSTLYVKSKL